MSNTTIDMKSEYLTPEEQEFDNLLTYKLIEVVRNPSMRKDFRQVITRMCKWDASSLFAFS